MDSNNKKLQNLNSSQSPPISNPLKLLAKAGILASTLTLAGIVLIVPLIMLQASQLKSKIEERSLQFKVRGEMNKI